MDGAARVINAETTTLGLHRIEDYLPLIGEAAVERIQKKAAALRGVRIAHVSSTFYGGGVAEILTPLTLLMNMLGVETSWRPIQGTGQFFACTKKIHNALQGARVEISDEEMEVYEEVVLENALRLDLQDYDAVVVHDPQPLPLIHHFAGAGIPWVWECHIDLSQPDRTIWKYLRPLVQQYDAAVLSLPEYAQDLQIPQHFIPPAINPFSLKNCEMPEKKADLCLAAHGIPTDLPLVVQISRFDRWKDPGGVIEAVQLARKEIDCALVLLGSNAVDDPEAQVVLETVHSYADERIVVVSVDDPALVNALQRRAAVVVQKSIREGFGLTVTEAMWKGAAVVGGNVGGIRHQIRDGENGYLVGSVEETAERIVELLRAPSLRRKLGKAARESVRNRFLLSRLVEDWLDLSAALVSPKAG